MAIRIQDNPANPSFRTDAEKALSAICPGVGFAANGTVLTAGVPCPDFCPHPAGCNLVTQLSQPGLPTLWIEDWSYSSRYLPSTGEILWNPDAYEYECCDGKDCPGGTGKIAHPAEAILAHELIHAWHYEVSGTFGSGSDWCREEWCTCCGENQVRKETGEPLRHSYEDGDCRLCTLECTPASLKGTGWGSYDCRTLPTDTPTECDCGGTSDAKGCLILILEWLFGKRTPVGPHPGPPIPIIPRFFRSWAGSSGTPPVPPPPLPPDWREGTGFGRLLAKPTAVSVGVEDSARMLFRRRQLDSLPLIDQTYRDSANAAFLEIVLLHGGYLSMLFAETSAEPVFAWNVALRGPGPTATRLRMDDLRQSTLSPSRWTEILTALRAPTFGPDSDGVAGDRGVVDGECFFLRVRVDGQERLTAVKNFSIGTSPSDSTGRPTDPGDGALWDPVKTVLDLGLEQIRRGGTHVVLRTL